MDIVLRLGELLGLGGFFYYLVRGLKAKIGALEGVITTQYKTLEVMERRVVETEKVGDIYRNLLSSLPSDIDNFKTVLSKTKDETIIELQNQNETIKTKLKTAETHIQRSGGSAELVAMHLRVLRNLLAPEGRKHGISERKSELVALCEFDGRLLEESVASIVTSRTFEEFVKTIGLRLHVKDEDSVIGLAMSDRKAPDGTPIRAFTAGHTMGGGWYCAVNNDLYVNQERLGFYKDRFSEAKTVV